MNIEFALRDEKINIFVMTYGNINSKMPYQIMLCKKEPFKENRMGPFILDTKKSSTNFPLSSIGCNYLKNIENKEYILKFIAFVDKQIKINISKELFDNICKNGFFQIWNPEGSMKYFEGKQEGYIILFRVYELEKPIDENLLEKGRLGRHYYYRLIDKVSYKIKRAALEDDEYLFIKQELIRTINNEKQNIYSESISNELKKELNNILVKEIEATNYNIYEEESFNEGNKKLEIHKTRERNPKVISRAKELFKIKNNNRLFCEICGFDFEEKYGEIGKDFIEGHHTIPISDMNENDKTKIEDIIMVCSNCHKMIHRKRPWLSKEELKEIIQQNQK